MTQKNSSVIIVICGNLKQDSFIFKQLKKNSVFHIFIKKKWYLAHPEEWFPNLNEPVRYIFSDGDAANYQLPETLRTSTENTVVIIWPGSQLPKRLDLWRVGLERLIDGSISSLKMNDEKAHRISNQIADNNVYELEAHDLNSKDMSANINLLSTPTRHFNSLIMEQKRISKLCKDPQKGRAEYAFLRTIPGDLKEYYLDVKAPNESGDSFSYSMNQLEMLDLSRHLIHNSLSETDWRIIFKNLAIYFESCPKKTVTREAYQESLAQFFIGKLHIRLNHYQTSDEIEKIKSSLLNKLKKAIEKTNGTKLYFSHGDLSFSNILLDLSTLNFKLIDPRGSIEAEGAYIPLEYDFAKLSHCIFGGYDWITAGYKALPLQKHPHPFLQNEFRKLMAQFKMDERLVRLGESSLFLSMLPLHCDRMDIQEQQIKAAEQALQQTQSSPHAC